MPSDDGAAGDGVPTGVLVALGVAVALGLGLIATVAVTDGLGDGVG